MIRPTYILSGLPFEEILMDVHLILQYDEQEYKNQMSYFRRLTQEGSKPIAYMERFEKRLEHARIRIEFFNQLFCRCQSYHFRCIAMALEKAEKEAIQYGKTNNYGVILFFNGNVMPEIIPI